MTSSGSEKPGSLGAHLQIGIVWRFDLNRQIGELRHGSTCDHAAQASLAGERDIRNTGVICVVRAAVRDLDAHTPRIMREHERTQFTADIQDNKSRDFQSASSR